MDQDTPQPEGVPAMVKYLRVLVTALSLTMIVGVVIMIALIVIRFREDRSAPALPASITLPQGASAIAFTQAPDWFAVVTDANQILIFARKTGVLVQTLNINTQ